MTGEESFYMTNAIKKKKAKICVSGIEKTDTGWSVIPTVLNETVVVEFDPVETLFEH